jgi:RNA-directed DNA polymerase
MFIASAIISLIGGAGSLYWFYRHTHGHPILWLKRLLGIGKNVHRLAEWLETDVDVLRHWQPAYRETRIPKKNGGHRILHVPDDDLKALQRRILRRLLAKPRTHPAAMAYERGKSIADNARPHVGRKVVIKLDLVDFFPSCRAERVEKYFRYIGWDMEAAAVLTRLCTHKDGLPQGAPTSPRLSNLLMFGFDEALTRFVRRRKGAYTRYADDITISFPKDYPRRIRGTIQLVKRLAKPQGLMVHCRKKLLILRRHQQQRVTGIVVNEKMQLPRLVRRTLRAVEHRLKTGQEATMTREQLAGMRAYEAMIVGRREAKE